ncbi:sulfur carrier protein ThiS adenylyltransferase ThiF [Candidatus Riflebacteria bacterium]
MGLSIFDRNVPGMTEALRDSCVAIAGCGGLGSNAAVALVRAGIGRLILADFDRVEESNLNRQYFFLSDVGKLKVEVMKERLLEINPQVKIETHNCELEPQKISLLFKDAALLIEAFDRAESKQWLIGAWCKEFPQKPIISGNGLSGAGNTGDLKIRSAGNIFFCGDGITDMSLGLCSARVAIVANMQANLAIELLMQANV